MNLSLWNIDVEISVVQLITWIIAISSVLASFLIGRYFLRKNSRNTWIGSINDLIDELEEASINFWMSKNGSDDIKEHGYLVAKIKKITTLARDIKKYGGCRYPQDIFIRLRQSVTHEDYYNNCLKKNESYTSYRNVAIKSVCDELRKIYVR